MWCVVSGDETPEIKYVLRGRPSVMVQPNPLYRFFVLVQLGLLNALQIVNGLDPAHICGVLVHALDQSLRRTHGGVDGAGRGKMERVVASGLAACPSPAADRRAPPSPATRRLAAPATSGGAFGAASLARTPAGSRHGASIELKMEDRRAPSSPGVCTSGSHRGGGSTVRCFGSIHAVSAARRVVPRIALLKIPGSWLPKSSDPTPGVRNAVLSRNFKKQYAVMRVYPGSHMAMQCCPRSAKNL